MNQASKQRLVGTIVLLCLALIIIPLLLDGEGIEPQVLTLDIPPAPQITPAPVDEPVRPEVVADSLNDQDQQAPEVDLSALPPFEATDADPEVASAAANITTEPATTAPAPAITAAPTLPTINQQGLPEAWVVRLGVFGERKNADSLLDQLLKAGYKAYPETVTNAQGTLTGVFVGPILTRAEANSLQAELKRRFKLDGLVRQFSLEAQP